MKKRIISLLLAVILVFSMMSTTAFAAGAEDPGTEPEAISGTEPETGTGTEPETGTGTEPEKGAASTLTAENVAVRTIHEDASEGEALELAFDEANKTFSGKLSNYTDLTAYNDADVSIVLTGLPEGTAAVLKSGAGEKIADFVDGTARTTGNAVVKAGTYTFEIALTNGESTESYRLVLEKITSFKWTKLVFEGTPGFLGLNYNGYPEGTLFQLDDRGERTGATGVSADCLHYEVYVSPYTTAVKPAGGKALNIFKNSFVLTPLTGAKISVYVNDQPLFENAPTVMSTAVKWSNLEGGIELAPGRTVMRVEVKISDTEVVSSTVTFVQSVKVGVEEITSLLESMNVDELVYPDDAKYVNSLQSFYAALTEEEKEQIPEELRQKLERAVEILGIDRVPETLKIVKAPTKLNYVKGDVFDPAGVELLATYSDGSTRTITAESIGFSVEPAEPLSNETEVTLIYNTVRLTQPISVLTVDWKGEGTAEVPYELATAEDLQTLYGYVASGQETTGLYFKMTADITLPEDWKPIGVLKDPSVGHIDRGANLYAFRGTFDGSGKTLTVPAGGLPLLGYVQGATVKNLNIYGPQIAGYGLVNNLEGVGLSGEAVCIDNVTLKSGTQTLKAGLIGTYITNNGFAGCSAAFYVTIRNCTVEKDVVIGYDGSQRMIGSIAGRIHGTIENCVSYATVKGTDYVGGILGTRDNAMGPCAVTGCEFHGTVEASGTQVGGIVGGGYSNGSAPNGGKIQINDCKSTGTITGKDKVGGILGSDTYVVQSWGNYSFKNNSFTGKVSATDGTYVGGIIGYYGSLNKHDDVSVNYYAEDCGADRGIGFVLYVDTDCETHETESGATYINTANGAPEISGITQANHNRSDDPLGADAGKLCYTDSTPDTATELRISGDYRTEYTTGDALDLTGMVLTVVFSTGRTENILLSDVTVTGYDADRPGDQTLTIAYGSLTADIQVQVRNAEGEITVTVSVLGDAVHDSGEDGKVHTLTAGNLTTWAAAKDYTVDSNATVWDVLQTAFKDNNITYTNSPKLGTVYIESLTYNGVTLAEIDNGVNSGWMYTLNGVHPNKGVDQQFLKDGDVIVFHYTDDYTKESDKAADIQVYVTISNAGNVVMAQKAITVEDRNSDRKFNVDEVLYAAHEAGFAGGAAAGYASEVGAYGLSITKLWGDESGSFGYWLNNASCRSLEDEVQAGDNLVAFVYRSSDWSDAYARFDQFTYTAEADLTVTLEKAGYDESWNTVFSKLPGAEITVYDAEGKELETSAYAVRDNGDGTYTIVFTEDGTYTLIATEDTTPIVPAVCTASVVLNRTDTDPAKVHEETGALLGGYDDSMYVFGSEWVILGLARSGLEVPDGYYESVVEYVKANINENGRLSRSKSTENSRLILALTAAGYDPTDVGGYNLLQGLNTMSFVQKQGINGPIWALIALDSHNYEIPAGGDVTREALIDAILAAQLPDGGWAFSGTKNDSDMTGMALQALAPYCGTNAKVKAAVDKAVAALSDMQREDGGFYTYNTDGTTYSSAESTAQVIVALTALGIDPETDPRFVKNGISAVDALCAYAVEGGGFKHLADGDLNGMATEQGYYALTAYVRFLGGKTSLYDMSDVVLRSADPGSTDQPGTPSDPGNTDQPGDTDQPGNTDQPGTPSDPGNTDQPGGTDRPDSTEQTGNTQKPGGTTASGSVSQNGTADPKTGDESQITVWTGLMLVSVLAAALLVRFRKRRRDA